MRLRNKKTGEIIELLAKPSFVKRCDDFMQSEINSFNSLAELNEEWEDYEEPKGKHWYMTSWGEVWQYGDDPLHEEWRIILGNDFETKEEAEKAVEKLKAWKRLKDNGFKFTGWDRHPDFPGDFRITASDEWTCDDKDLDLLFGDEE